MEDSITVKVKFSSRDEAVEVSARKTQSVEQLKQQIAAVSSIPADKQRLIYKGKLLKDTDNLATVGLEDGTTVHVAPMGASAAPAPSVSSPASTSPASASTPATPAPTPTYPPNQGLLSAFDNAMRTLLDNPEDVAKESVTVLHKVVSNIHDHPMEEKYRRLKKTNATFHRKLGGLPGGIAALKAMGFAENGDDLTLQPSAELWPVIVAVKRKLDGLVARMNGGASAFVASAAPRAAPAPNTSTMPAMDPATLQQFLQGLQQLQAQQQQSGTDSPQPESKDTGDQS